MLTRLFVKNFILIDELSLEFDRGLNIITGETGAGKSIMISAIDIALGAKASKELIKSGEEKALIELTISLTGQDLTSFYEENGIDSLGDELVITKEITQTASRSKVNGSMVNQDAIKYLRESLIDIHSQHQMYSFMKPKCHIDLLDNYARATLKNDLDEYGFVWQNYLAMNRKLEDLKTSNNLSESQVEFLKFQLNEIEEAEITSETEDVDLEQEIAVLENAEKLKELSGAVSWALNNDDESILEGLNKIKKTLSQIVSMDTSLSETESELIDVIENVKNISSVLRDYSQSVTNDTERLNLLQERQFLLDKLKRKYGGTLANVMKTYFDFQKELAAIENKEVDTAQLEQDIAQALVRLKSLARIISEKRKTYAEVLSSMISEKLMALELPKAKFLIDVREAELNSRGADEVEFLISTNVSESPKPLVKVASGGEISRVMLAIKTIFAQADNIGTVIFDEIDTGISGKTSQSVADEVKNLAQFMQIIMITHQAIIASKSDKHLYVKKTQNNKTNVEIFVLEGEAKLKAIAELASGEITEDSLKFAKMLIG